MIVAYFRQLCCCLNKQTFQMDNSSFRSLYHVISNLCNIFSSYYIDNKADFYQIHRRFSPGRDGYQFGGWQNQDAIHFFKSGKQISIATEQYKQYNNINILWSYIIFVNKWGWSKKKLVIIIGDAPPLKTPAYWLHHFLK